MNLKLKLSSNKWVIPGLVFFLILIIVGVYFLFLYPKMGFIEQKEKELKMQQQLLKTLESNIGKSSETTSESTVALQKLVPVKPLAEQLLLNIEKAEVVSNSFVLSMDFSDAEVTIEEETPADGDREPGENNGADIKAQNEKADTVGTEEQSAETPKDNTGKKETQKLSLPQGVKKITISMNVESPNYFDLESFIRTLENSERIMVIESIDFTANEEIIEYEQVDKPISYQVTASAFYIPTLTDLMDQLPRIEGSEPAEKKNPFSNFGDYTGSIPNFKPGPYKNN